MATSFARCTGRPLLDQRGTPMTRRLLSFFCLLACLPFAAQAEFKDENLLHGLPAGYKIDFQDRKGNMVMTEMVPQAESVKNWTEMLTSQIFLGVKTATPESFQARMQQSFAGLCKGASSAWVTQGQENGYPVGVWVQICPLNPATNKPEHVWFKAIKGNDSFYVVQRAYRYQPSREQVTQAMAHLREVKVCDSRLPDRPCPKVNKPAQ
jgi:hypothetical protein